MKFLKENSYDIVRFIVNQIGITIFSLVLYTAVGMVDSANNPGLALKLRVVLSFFATAFYFVLLYTASWDIGAKDRIRIDGGRLKESKIKGALLATIANVLNFLLSIACIIAMFISMADSTEGVSGVAAAFNLIIRFIMAMYLGIIQGVFIAFESNTELYFALQSIGYFVLPIFAVITSHLGYIMGLKEKKIFSSTQSKKT